MVQALVPSVIYLLFWPPYKPMGFCSFIFAALACTFLVWDEMDACLNFAGRKKEKKNTTNIYIAQYVGDLD